MQTSPHRHLLNRDNTAFAEVEATVCENGIGKTPDEAVAIELPEGPSRLRGPLVLTVLALIALAAVAMLMPAGVETGEFLVHATHLASKS